MEILRDVALILRLFPSESIFIFCLISVVHGLAADVVDSLHLTDLGHSVVRSEKNLDMGRHNVDKVQVLDSSEIRRRGAFNAIELLSTVPGMDIDPARTRTNLKLNGLGGSYVKILVDGIPVTGDVGGGYPLENLMVGDLESVEVLSGASSAMFGSDAMGGVVNFVSRKYRQPTKLGMDLQIRHLHNDSLTEWGGKNRADLSLYHASANLEVNVYGGVDYDDGIQHKKKLEGTPYTLYSYESDYRYKLGGRLSVHPDESWSLTPSFQMMRSGGTSSSGTSLLELTTESQSYNLSGEWLAFSRVEFAGYASLRFLDHANDSRTQIGFVTQTKTHTDFLDKEAELRAHIELPRLGGESARWILGTNLLSEEVESDNLRAGVQRDQVAAFSSATWASATPIQFVIVPSLRLTLTDREPTGENWSFDDLSPKLGLRLNRLLWKPLSLSFSYGEAFKNPGLKHMYYSFNMGNSMWIEGNSRLDPEKSRTFSAGIEWDNADDMNLSVNAYHTRLRDMVVLSQVTDIDGSQKQRGLAGEDGEQLNDYSGALLPENTYVNADEGKSYGVSLAASLLPISWFRISASYAYTVSQAQTSSGDMRDVAGITPHMVQSSMTLLPMRKAWWWPESRISIQWRDRSIDKWSGDSATYVAAFTRVSLYFGKEVMQNVFLDLGANNLLGEVHDGHLGLDYGRTYFIGMRWNAPRIF